MQTLRTGLPTITSGASTVFKLYPELPDCLRSPKSDSTPGDTGHPVNLNSVIMDITPKRQPDAEREKQQDAGEQSAKEKLSRVWADMTTSQANSNCTDVRQRKHMEAGALL